MLSHFMTGLVKDLFFSRWESNRSDQNWMISKIGINKFKIKIFLIFINGK